MSRNKVFMNRPKPEDGHAARMLERLDLSLAIRPLDGTNLAWMYERDQKVDSYNRAPDVPYAVDNKSKSY